VASPFQAVLLIAFGGPQGPQDIRPFLANVLSGRRISPERVEEVTHHYELFGGVSPLTRLTLAQAARLEGRLAQEGPAVPVFVGMRNWHPFLADTLRAMAGRGVKRAIGVILAAHRSYSSCLQYKENVRDAQAALRAQGLAPPEVVYAGDWHTHPGFIETHARHIEMARARLPAAVRADARVVFTAHSIPLSMAAQYPYREQLLETAKLVAARLETHDWAVVYQSRSGRPEDQWLEPDVCEYLKAERSRGLSAAVLAPIGFVCDHVEILYDLDTEAAQVCRAIGLPMERAAAPNDDPVFVSVLADAVARTWNRYQRTRPLSLGGPC
jgi:ferrochelatase